MTTVDRPASFDAAVIQWLPFLRKMAYRLERNRQDREDLVNETVATALKRWENYNASFALPGWLAFQMRSVVNDARRRKRVATVSYSTAREREFDDDGNGGSMRTLLDRHVVPPSQDDIVCARQVVDALSGRDGDVVLRHAMGDTLEEIGQQYGITRERVRQIETRGRAAVMRMAA